MKFDRRTIKSLVSTVYQLQKLRIQTGLRVVGNAKVKLGQQPGEKEDDLDDQAKEILLQLRASYNRISDALGGKSIRKGVTFQGDGLITDEAEYSLAQTYFTLLKQEEDTFDMIDRLVATHPMYPWIQATSGFGTGMAAVMLSSIDLDIATNLGKVYAYCGLDTVIIEDEHGNMKSEARSRKTHHLVEREYRDKDDNVKTKMSITYNEFLHTKLLGVVADCLIKAGGYFKTEVYNNYKFRLLNDPKHIGKTDAHLNMMARRYMVKIFVMYFYKELCRVEGREPGPLYHEAKLGLTHSGPLFEKDAKRTPETLQTNRAAAARLKETADARKVVRKQLGLIGKSETINA